MNYVYILRCADGTLYSGWTIDLTHRLAAHNGGEAGAKYTRTRRPVALAHCEAYETRSEAMRREAALKRLTRAQKEAVVAGTASAGGEFLTVYDARMTPCGELPRALVHRCALRHRVVHTLVFETRGGVQGVWLQQRGFDRPTLPGFYDWSATGHLDPGEAPAEGAAREAREETGLTLTPDALVPAGEYHIRTVRGPGFEDDEVAYAFLYFAERTPTFAPGPEVARMVWTPCRAVTAAMKDGAPLPVVGADGAREEIPAERLSPNRSEWGKLTREFLRKERACSR